MCLEVPIVLVLGSVVAVVLLHCRIRSSWGLCSSTPVTFGVPVVPCARILPPSFPFVLGPALVVDVLGGPLGVSPDVPTGSPVSQDLGFGRVLRNRFRGKIRFM